jgi:Exostosin family
MLFGVLTAYSLAVSSSWIRKQSEDQQQHQQQDTAVNQFTRTLNLTPQIPTTPIVDHKFNNNHTSVFAEQQSNNDDANFNINVYTNERDSADPDADCIFRNSPIYRSVYVYPSPGEPEWTSERDLILSPQGKARKSSFRYPWTLIDEESKHLLRGPYNISSKVAQYNTELLVRLILTHPDSCLRTHDPEQATLFYVPYLMSAAYHIGDAPVKDRNKRKAPYGQAIMDIITDHNNTDGWERHFGWTSRYWQRRQGSDHVIVYSEALHGLWHPRNKRGNFHFLHTQYWTHPPIAVAIGSSTSFVERYPNCAQKNILLPYPNTDGRWYNGVWDRHVKNEVLQITVDAANTRTNVSKPLTSAALRSELELSTRLVKDVNAFLNDTKAGRMISDDDNRHRVLAYYYQAGSHGVCKDLRVTLSEDFECSASGQWLEQVASKRRDLPINYRHGYRMATFCPCPGGDSPSAKRMFDVIHAGCIPVVLSHDHVWPFSSSEISYGQPKPNGGIDTLLDPKSFSIRLNSTDFVESPRKGNKCPGGGETIVGRLQQFLETIPSTEIVRLRRGLQKAANLYSYYKYRPDLPDNPLLHDILPDGGTAHVLVQALAERSSGRLWPGCQAEMTRVNRTKDDISVFQC